MERKIRSTTVLGVIHKGVAALGGDGQVTLGNTVMKHNSMKIRRLLDGKVLVGFAGSAADAFTLLGRFEEKLDQYRGNVDRAVVELAKDWRTDKYLRKLEALLAVVSSDLWGRLAAILAGVKHIIAIGSGGMYALSAAKMLVKFSDLSAEEIVRESLKVASEICIYTNDKINIETIGK